MVLHLSKSYEADWDPEAFSEMCNIRLLIILSDLQFPRGLKRLPSALKVLEWLGYPLKVLPLGNLDKLVSLKMHSSKIKQLWNGIQCFEELKFVELSRSECLINTPNFSGVPNLERLILEGCTFLVEVHPSLGQLKKLHVVNLKDCKNLRTLPSKLEMDSLEVFILSGCSKVKMLPEFGENMESLVTLDLEETAIVKLPASLGFLISLEALNLRGCKNLVCLPHTIHNLKHLRILNTSGCPKFSKLPENLNENEALEMLDVSGTAIREVPSSIVHLGKLKTLSFRGCKGLAFNLRSIPLSFSPMFLWYPVVGGLTLSPPTSALKSLTHLDLSYCSIGEGIIPDDLGCLPSLCELNLAGNNFVNLPIGCISNLLQLQYLDLNNCMRLQSFPMLPPSLLRLEAGDCASIAPLTDQQLWDITVALEQQHHCPAKDSHMICTPSEIESGYPHNDFFATIPGSEIPSWFHNRSYFHIPADGKLVSGVSIIVDIPQSCRVSEWSAIAVCFVVDDLFDHHNVTVDENLVELLGMSSIFWLYNAPENENLSYRGWGHSINVEGDYPHLYILFLHCNVKPWWQDLRGDGIQIQIKFYTVADLLQRRPAKIKQCGWRVLCKEDIP